RVVLPGQLLLRRDRRLEVALLVPGLAVGIRLGALVGPPRERQRRAEKRRVAERDGPIVIGAGRALLVEDQLLELVERCLVPLVAGLRRPQLGFLIERRLALEEVPRGQA